MPYRSCLECTTEVNLEGKVICFTGNTVSIMVIQYLMVILTGSTVSIAFMEAEASVEFS